MGNKNSKSKKKNANNQQQKPQDIFCYEILQTTCDGTLMNCFAAERLSKILIKYHEFKTHPQTCQFQSMNECINRLSNAYTNRTLLNDYIHLLTTHNSNKDYECVYRYFVSELKDKCDVMSCNFFTRYQRDRSQDYANINIRQELFNSTETKEINTQEIIDKIHCYWLHTFDLGYRLTEKEIQAMSIDTNETKMNDRRLTNYIDNELVYRQKIICNKRRRFTETESKQQMVVDDRNRNAKWMLTKDENGKRIKDAKLGQIYSFGFPYKYGKYHKRHAWHIPKKYENFKIEITTNTTHYLSINEYNDWYEKAENYFNSFYCKQMPQYMGERITIEQLLAVMIYCGADELQRTLTETYRRFGAESDAQLKKRHSEFANWGDLLQHTINYFGKEVSKSGIKTFYHGIDHEMTFQSTVAFFNGPLSTSSEYQVALVFATRTNNSTRGLIIELEHLDGSHACYFDCEWISEYPYESEKLFIGGEFGLIIKNIVEPISGENYGIFIEGLNIMEQMMRGEMYKCNKELPKYMKKCVYKLLNHQLSKSSKDNKYIKFDEIPNYINNVLQCYCVNVIEAKIDWRALHGINENKTYKGYDFVKDIFVIDDFNHSSIDLSVVSLLFQNANTLTIIDIRWCRNAVEAMLDCCKKLDVNSTLKNVIIYRPTKVFSFEDSEQDEIEIKFENKSFEPDEYDNLKEVNVIDIAIEQYAQQFKDIGWVLELKARFELIVSRIIESDTAK